MAQGNSVFCSENFKQQPWKAKLENWHEPSNKSEVTGFYMEKSSKVTGSLHGVFQIPIFLQLPILW